MDRNLTGALVAILITALIIASTVVFVTSNNNELERHRVDACSSISAEVARIACIQGAMSGR